MQRDMQREDACKVLVSALRLARERVTGELDEKEFARERIADLTARMRTGAESAPTAGDLREVLADQDPEIRAALAAWT